MVIEFSKDLIFKICIFGDRYVGKTELLRAYVPKIMNEQKKTPNIYFKLGEKKLFLINSY